MFRTLSKLFNKRGKDLLKKYRRFLLSELECATPKPEQVFQLLCEREVAAGVGQVIPLSRERERELQDEQGGILKTTLRVNESTMGWKLGDMSVILLGHLKMV